MDQPFTGNSGPFADARLDNQIAQNPHIQNTIPAHLLHNSYTIGAYNEVIPERGTLETE
jgi:hypothetical protein